MRAAVPEIDVEKCTGCGDCVEECPTSAVELVSSKVAIVRPEDCNYCTDCESFCPSGAIRCSFEIVLLEVKPEGYEERQMNSNGRSNGGRRAISR